MATATRESDQDTDEPKVQFFERDWRNVPDRERGGDPE